MARRNKPASRQTKRAQPSRSPRRTRASRGTQGDRREAPASTAPSRVSPAGAPAIVAVLNSNQSVLRLIRTALEDDGHTVTVGHIEHFKDGSANLAEFLGRHHPNVIVYDVAPPYQENWTFLQLLRRVPEFAAIPIVLTTVNKAALDGAVGHTTAFEVLGTRDDLAPLVDEINQVIRSGRRSKRTIP